MRATIVNVIAVSAGLLGVVTTAPDAHADETAYLVNVTVRPDYNVASADDALTYGRGVCAKVAAGQPYPQLIAEMLTDFGTSEEYQASYLSTQAVNELCPALIWQLRNSAAQYGPSPWRPPEGAS
jgi:Protein of unknown function (DUF732)